MSNYPLIMRLNLATGDLPSLIYCKNPKTSDTKIKIVVINLNLYSVVLLDTVIIVVCPKDADVMANSVALEEQSDLQEGPLK